MAEFASWGPEQSGPRLAQKDQQSAMMNELSAQKTRGEIAMQPAQAELATAHARLYGADASLKEEELAIKQRVATAMNDLSQKGSLPDDPADQMDMMAKLRLQAGDVTGAADLYGKSELVRARKANEESRRASADKAQLETTAKHLELFGGITGAVRDQASLDRMFMLAHQAIAGMKNPQMKEQSLAMLDRIPKDYESAKDFLKQISESTIKAADKAKLELKEQDLARKEAAVADRERTAAIVREVNEARRDLIVARTEALEKNAGPQASAANRDRDAVLANAFIKDQFGGKTSENLMLGAAELSENARKLMRTNPALTYNQALAQSFDPADWSSEKGGMLSSDKVKFAGGGKTALTPLPLPITNGKIDLPKIRGEKFYSTPDKKVWQRRGDKMVEVQPNG